MIRHQLFAEPRGRGWYIADAEMRDISGVIYISKRAAVTSIRAMPAPPPADHPLFDNVKEFVTESAEGGLRAACRHAPDRE